MPGPSPLGLAFAIQLLCLLLCQRTQGFPNLNNTSQEPVLVPPGEDAFLDCKVEKQDNYTVVWKFLNPDANIEHGQVLTAGDVRVINDARFTSLHHAEHELWVLKISNAQPSDSGVYLCEVNSVPSQNIARLLSVAIQETDDDEIEDEQKTPASFHDLNHNYTDCCINNAVPTMCQSFCHFNGLINGDTPQYVVQSCLPHLGSITKCLTDGRNHLPCCQRQAIPITCQSVCIGNFTLTTVTDHFSCMSYAAPILACVAEGVITLPQPPKYIKVDPTSSTEINIQWERPDNYYNVSVDNYQINITQLHTFDGLSGNEKKIANLREIDTSSPPSLYGLQMSYTINGTLTSYLIKDLKPFTMYEIRMYSSNKKGTSLLTNAIRTLTLSPDDSLEVATKPPGNQEPVLPNFRKCCEDAGVQLDRCLDTLCDPTKADAASLSDLMICAPWANVTFKCMSLTSAKDKKYIDHSNCCRQRGVTDVCLPLCQGTVKRIDFRHFVCLDHMSAYTSCILEHHQVLPSEPVDFTISSVDHSWAVFKWKPPRKLAHTVEKYYIHWREAASEASQIYQVDIAKRSPYLLDKLKPGSRYEAYVVSVNKYGSSQSSVRVLFSTPSLITNEEIELETADHGYNETACCERASLASHCMPLCTYKVKVADVIGLSSVCANSLPTLVRCGAGGRNHVSCCRRGGVSEGCLNVCAGLVDTSPFVIATRCSSDFGRIIQCMEAGSGLLPGLPSGLHAELVTKSSVQVAWKPADEDSKAGHITYQVRYSKVISGQPLHPLEHFGVLNATKTSAVIDQLESNTKYSIYVTAHNLYGVSLPSLILIISTLKQDQDDSKDVVHAKIGPPHSIEVLQQNVDSITFKWLPPLYVPIDSSITYIVYYKVVNGTSSISNPSKDSWSFIQTSYTTMLLTNLTFNTEYAIAIQAISNKNESSQLSEVILIWTDSAIPAQVQTPVVVPSGPVVEASNVTVMCIAVGTPVPMLSMFINGQIIARRETRHLAFNVNNVDRNLSTISCYANNGVNEPSQSTLDIRVRFKPYTHTLNPSPSSSLYGPARMMCQVSSNPIAKVSWHKQSSDGTQMTQIVKGDNVDLITVPHADLALTWIFTLLIKQSNFSDAGNYLCSVENDYGKSVESMSLEVKPMSEYQRNTTGCCKEQGVNDECLSVCSLDVDIEQALSKPECFGELDKLMSCAADGSDHRQCCRRRNVPSGCLRWCAGLRVNIPSLCVLSSARDIISCFQEGKALLPGPPKEVHVQKFIDQNTVMIEWTPPEKNPELVQWYRVFWRPVGSRDLMRNQTDTPNFELNHLESGKMYEFVVKSGNHYGLSVFTDPLVVTIRDSRTASKSLGNKLLSVLVSIGVGVVFVICGIGATIYYYKQHYGGKSKGTSRPISFENPTYMKDTNTVQIQNCDNNVINDRVEFNNMRNENSENL